MKKREILRRLNEIVAEYATVDSRESLADLDAIYCVVTALRDKLAAESQKRRQPPKKWSKETKRIVRTAVSLLREKGCTDVEHGIACNALYRDVSQRVVEKYGYIHVVEVSVRRALTALKPFIPIAMASNDDNTFVYYLQEG